MAHKKNNYALILASFLLVLTGCKKESKPSERNQFIISFTHANTGEGFSDIPYVVIETHVEDPGLGAKITEDTIATGKTDSSGKAEVIFYRKFGNEEDGHYSDYYSYDVNLSHAYIIEDIIGFEFEYVKFEQQVPIDTNNNIYGFNYEILPK